MINKIIKRGDIYWAQLNAHGSVQGGIRPVIVISNNKGNMYSPTVIVVPLTSNLNKTKLPTHVFVSVKTGIPKDSLALMEQIITINKTQLGEKIGECDKSTMKRLNAAYLIAGGLCEIQGNKLVKAM